MFDTIYNDIYHIKDKIKLPICLVGDMNSRTGNLNDILTFEREVINYSETNEFAQDFFEISIFEGNDRINKKKELTQIKQSIQMVKSS